MNDHYQRTTCRICNGKAFENVIRMPKTPIGDLYIKEDRLFDQQSTYPLSVYFCNDCGLIQLLDVINPEIIYKDYIYETKASLGLDHHFSKYAESVVNDLGLAPDSLVIDIGCNDATLLKAFRSQGMKVVGVEPVELIAEKNNQDGIKTFSEFFSSALIKKIKVEYGAADLITANNVMANIDDLSDFLSNVKDLLSPSGVFVFESGYGAELVSNCVLDNIHHEHYSYFTLTPILYLFEKNGLEVIDVKYVDTKGGSIRVFGQYKGGMRQINESVSERKHYEERLKFNRAETYQDYSIKMSQLKDELHNKLSKYKQEGLKIGAYGASVGVTTLLYYFGLEDYISVLFDDNEVRHGLYSPGLHIPVMSSEHIYNENIDIIVILAWRYADPIIKRHAKFSELGGKFLIPLPAIEMV